MEHFVQYLHIRIINTTILCQDWFIKNHTQPGNVLLLGWVLTIFYESVFTTGYLHFVQSNIDCNFWTLLYKTLTNPNDAFSSYNINTDNLLWIFSQTDFNKHFCKIIISLQFVIATLMVQQMKSATSLMEVVFAQMDTMEKNANLVSLVINCVN